MPKCDLLAAIDEMELPSVRSRPFSYLPVRSGLSTSCDAYLRALVDTGADHTLVPFSIAEDVGAELFVDEEDAARGVSGHYIPIIPGRVELELLADGESYRWPATIGFAKFAAPEDECSVLGHASCLEYFLATFDGVAQFVELTPRTTLPTS
jgi:hypothetical protein